jgi:hypothetical protein
VSFRNEMSSDILVNICAGKYNLDEKKNMLFTLFLGVFAKLQLLASHVCPSVCLSAQNNLAPTRQIYMKFDILRIFRISVDI